MDILIGVLVTAGIVCIYLMTFLLNKNTHSPMEESDADPEVCGTCANYTCGVKQKHFTEEVRS